MQRSRGDYGLTPAYDLLSSSIHLPNESRTALELLEISFLSTEAKERYEALFLDRVRAVEYRFSF